ncbi:MAG TPA: methyltransferase domain-containing protein [Rhizomicrobium sp.]|nr:methyltransferase domain-containing protein [Rhizomicrobium sp.]
MTAPIVFDRRLYAGRRLRAERDAQYSFLLGHAGDNLAERLGTVKRHFSIALDLSTRDQSFGLFKTRADRWVRTALHPDSRAVCLVADEEALPFAAGSFDLVVSVLGLHAVNDLPGALVQIRRTLKPGGLFMAALFGGATLKELRRALALGETEATGGTSPHVAPFADVRDMGALLQRAGFVSAVADSDTLPVRYGSFAGLVGDMRALGETNALAQRRRRPLPRRAYSATLKSYAQNDGRNGKLAATFEILYLTGWAPNDDL